jgi:hypothetical protein
MRYGNSWQVDCHDQPDEPVGQNPVSKGTMNRSIQMPCQTKLTNVQDIGMKELRGDKQY